MNTLKHVTSRNHYLSIALAFATGLMFAIQCQAITPDIRKLCRDPAAAVQQEQFVSLGGIEQWVTIKGDRCDNPVILFLHGGPANPTSLYADAIYAGWEKHFTLVQWDQRGAGKTFIRNPATAEGKLTIPMMVNDGLALTQYLQHALGQRKIILMGSSWGSILGINMVQQQPERFHAYIGSSQVVSKTLNSSASYEKTLGLVKAAGDSANLKILQDLGAPPWAKPNGILRRVNRQYETKTSTPAPAHWWVPAASYRMEEFASQYEAAEEYSFIQFVGFNNDGMYADVNFPKTATRFQLPVFFVQGVDDLVTVPEVTTAYVAQISAPQKQLVLVEQAAHNPNEASIAAEYKILQQVAAGIKP